MDLIFTAMLQRFIHQGICNSFTVMTKIDEIANFSSMPECLPASAVWTNAQVAVDLPITFRNENCVQC